MKITIKFRFFFDFSRNCSFDNFKIKNLYFLNYIYFKSNNCVTIKIKSIIDRSFRLLI
jgi:hypothetical protein